MSSAAAIGVLAVCLAALAAGHLRRHGMPDSRGGRALLAAVALLALHACQVEWREMHHVLTRETDFGILRDAAAALTNGGDPYAATGGLFFHPPLAAALLVPSTWLPAGWAHLLFFCLKLLLVVWSLDAVRRLVGGPARPLFTFGLIFVAAKFWLDDLQFGNTNTLTMALVIAAIDADGRDRPVLAGLALAVAGSLKIVPALLLVHFMASGRWRTAGSAVGAALVLNLAPLAVAPGAWSAAWISFWNLGVRRKLGSAIAEPVNQSLWGWLHRTLPDARDVTLFWIWAALAITLVLALAWFSRRTRRGPALAALAAASLYPAAGLVVSPGSWVVHYTAVLLPMVLLWKLALDRVWPGRTPWALLIALNLAFTASGWSRWSVDASLRQSWFLAGALALLGGLGWWIARGGGKKQPVPAEAGTGFRK